MAQMAVRTQRGSSRGASRDRTEAAPARKRSAGGRRARRAAIDPALPTMPDAPETPARAVVPGFERRRVREVRLGSVARVSLFFYLCGLAAFMTAAVVVWVVASAFGVVGELEGFMDDLGFEGFEFVSGTLLWAVLIIGLAITAILVVLTVFAAAVYNLFADFAGGIEVTLEAPDHDHDLAEFDGDGSRAQNRNGARRP